MVVVVVSVRVVGISIAAAVVLRVRRVAMSASTAIAMAVVAVECVVLMGVERVVSVPALLKAVIAVCWVIAVRMSLEASV